MKKNRRHLPRAAGEASFALIVFCYKTKKTEKSLEKTILFLLLLLLLSINPSFPECFRVERYRSKVQFVPFDGFSYTLHSCTQKTHTNHSSIQLKKEM
jgi:hypothetical protein